MKKLQFIGIGILFRIIGKICKDIERAFRFKGINVNFIGKLEVIDLFEVRLNILYCSFRFYG